MVLITRYLWNFSGVCHFAAARCVRAMTLYAGGLVSFLPQRLRLSAIELHLAGTRMSQAGSDIAARREPGRGFRAEPGLEQN